MSSKLTVLVSGATGQQGGALARVLLDKGHHVRAMTRNTESEKAIALAGAGAEIVQADLTDPAALAEAAKGVDTIFAMSTPFEAGMATETSQGLNMIEAAKRAGVKHLVYTSVAGADLKTGIPHFDSKYAVEEVLTASDVPYTIIAPVFFMENWTGPWFFPPLQQGNAALAIPGGRKLHQVALGDIGRFAALVIEQRDRFIGRRIELSSDELTGEEVAEKLGRHLGRNFGYQEIPLEMLRADNPDFARMFEWFDEVGYAVDIADLRQTYPEVGWTDFDGWIKAQDWSGLDEKAT
jgi:uncharacterized protein YbjT (DUF2867 family)